MNDGNRTSSPPLAAKPTQSRMGKHIPSKRFVAAVIIDPSPDFPDEYTVRDWAEDSAAITAAIREMADHWERETLAALGKSS